ncbi:Co2+/Mg2+ efflux protein ApaG [Aestuariicella hydrocarbonica]|uniref:Protein ApaG n=1 Tax=Pseudomaricurvus hydrocarbonicus TaxID=1470433 RepID=A0A9E5MM73_9GAMM|nr:Co2+/Mg2+ efflux protein ApaG [Aestuariicella hydrocarbonica]NHO66488.1 Co2+/Mg2+ efflux protein ApaG [Aestuariicella hydrocarbonica]
MREIRDSVRVSVKTHYLPDQSSPSEKKFVFAYTITLRNEGDENAQLISRRWKITDANNDVQEVAGIGVVGEQPTLAPGEEYTYTSGSVLETETGTMEGAYQMRTDSGEDFDILIPAFALVPPHRLH